MSNLRPATLTEMYDPSAVRRPVRIYSQLLLPKL